MDFVKLSFVFVLLNIQHFKLSKLFIICWAIFLTKKVHELSNNQDLYIFKIEWLCFYNQALNINQFIMIQFLIINISNLSFLNYQQFLLCKIQNFVKQEQILYPEIIYVVFDRITFSTRPRKCGEEDCFIDGSTNLMKSQQKVHYTLKNEESLGHPDSKQFGALLLKLVTWSRSNMNQTQHDFLKQITHELTTTIIIYIQIQEKKS
eukprot:TRINITY_DN16299_c0_g1_i2.p2 TRINITY_DN16299_c0_g1~~TRINITY_DN16299_c0_g1_i2.p2  ORF type:complete len:206 (-),score=-3.42 TRINITY_DN16299_c0_g1_i2:1568-2185(-)